VLLMSESLRVQLLAVVVGVLTGLLGAAFRFCDQHGYTLFSEVVGGSGDLPVPGWLIGVILGAVFVSVAVYLTSHFAPEAAGSGIQEIEGTLKNVRPPIRWKRVLPVKFVGGVLAMSSGLVLGREGPTIQMGGAFGAMVGQGTKLTRYDQDVLIAAGSGAGLAVAFSAPLGGILFVAEELRDKFSMNTVALQGVILAGVVATLVSELVLGPARILPIAIYHSPTWGELSITVPFAVFVGLFAVFFNAAVVKSLDWTRALKIRFGWLPVAAITGGGIGLLVWAFPAATGSGEVFSTDLLRSPHALSFLFVLLFARVIVFNISYAAGTPGGIFAPQLAFGALLGLLYAVVVGLAFPDLIEEPGRFAVAGMAGLIASTVRAPLTGLALVAEMTGNFALIPMMLVVSAVAAVTADFLGARPIYDQLLDRMLQLEKPAQSAAL
jgi:CIC family chloride channel protein